MRGDDEMSEDKVLFDCGCVIGRDGKMFVIIPCSPDCKVLRYCLEESEKKGNPIHFIQAKEAES